MNEFIEKLIERLEEEKEGYSDTTYYALGIGSAIKIVNKLAEEYDDINIITDFLQYVRDNADNYDADNGWDLSDLIDLSIKFCDAEEYNGGWIPCRERLPKENGYYLVTYKKDGNLLVGYWFFNGVDFNQTEEVEVLYWQHLPEPYKPKGE